MIHNFKQGGGDLITNTFLQNVVYRRHTNLLVAQVRVAAGK